MAGMSGSALGCPRARAGNHGSMGAGNLPARQTLHRVLAGRSAVTPEMVRLGKFCGNGPALWLRMQQAYDLWHAERRLRREVDRIPTAAA
jgi:hypothetical protein